MHIWLLYYQCNCISGGALVFLEYSNKHGKLHEGLDYIVYLQYWSNLDCITVVLKG